MAVVAKKDCSCTSVVRCKSMHGVDQCYGNCKGVSVERKSGEKGPICFVNEPSNCADLAEDKGRKYSWEACSSMAVSVVNGEWSDWVEGTCTDGKRTDTRKCANPPPSGGGATCSG